MKKIWLWTEEEFKDLIAKACVVGIVSFMATMTYGAVDKWLRETKWS